MATRGLRRRKKDISFLVREDVKKPKLTDGLIEIHPRRYLGDQEKISTIFHFVTSYIETQVSR